MDSIRIELNLIEINNWLIAHIPSTDSAKLPSRGMVMALIVLNDHEYTIPLEPDGNGSHWFHINDDIARDIHMSGGESFSITLTPLNDWTKPNLPDDLNKALRDNGVSSQWEAITPKAQWEWVRWIRFTKNPTTRAKRIDTACSMLFSGKKRPCCFDHSRCTVSEVSKSGVLDLKK